MTGPHAFSRCTACAHASMYRPGQACRVCAGEVREEPAPHDLWSGWRCTCFNCLAKMC